MLGTRKMRQGKMRMWGQFMSRSAGLALLVVLLTGINAALHARALLKRDVDYLVRDGRIELIDEFTGRVVDDRHLPDGLQAAVEAKEGLAGGAAGSGLGCTHPAQTVHLKCPNSACPRESRS